MRLNAPKKNVWWITTIAVALGIVGTFVSLPVVSGISFWLILGGYILLWLSTFIKGL